VECFSSNSEVWKKKIWDSEISKQWDRAQAQALWQLKEFAKNPILHHFMIGKDHWILLAKTARVLSPQIWASLEQSHWICIFLPSKAPWGPYGPLGVNKAPSGLIVKTKSNQSQAREVTLLEVLYSCLMSRYRWEGRWLRLKTSTFKPYHIICQLGSTLDTRSIVWRLRF
jgi:hypothetical protein